MKQNLSDILVSLAVVVCSVVLLGALTMALSGWNAGGPGRAVDINFSDIAGIKVNSELRYAGAPAGRVTAIRALTTEERKKLPADQKKLAVRVTVTLNEKVGSIAKDTVASISSDTLLGEKYVALSAGTPDVGELAPGTVLTGVPGFNIESLTASVAPLMQNADATLTTLRTEIAKLMPEVQSLVGNTQTVANSANALLTRTDKLIADNEDGIHRRIEEMGIVMDKLSGVIIRTNETLVATKSLITNTDRELGGRMGEMGVVLQNLKVITTQAKSFTEQIGEKPSRLIWGFGKAKQLTPESEIIDSPQPVPSGR